MPDLLVYSTFKPLLNTRFLLHTAEDSRVELSLIEVAALPKRSAVGTAVRPEPFSLVFRSPAGIALPQGIHVMEHEALGVVEIFLVPIRPDAAGPRYEAVFN